MKSNTLWSLVNWASLVFHIARSYASELTDAGYLSSFDRIIGFAS